MGTSPTCAANCIERFSLVGSETQPLSARFVRRVSRWCARSKRSADLSAGSGTSPLAENMTGVFLCRGEAGRAKARCAATIVPAFFQRAMPLSLVAVSSTLTTSSPKCFGLMRGSNDAVIMLWSSSASSVAATPPDAFTFAL